MEVFKPVIGFENQYLISDLGNVFSLHRNRLITPKHSATGYLRVTLCDNGRKRNTGIHRLVAEAFLPNPENKPTVNHINEIKTDNRVVNLEWATVAEQNCYGTRTERAKTHTDWKARNIDYIEVARKHDYSKDNMCNRKRTAVFKNGKAVGVFRTQKEAAEACGVSRGSVSMCALGKRKSVNGYTFEEFPIAVTKKHFPEEEDER